MKTFINAVRFAFIALLFVSLTSLADCCKKECGVKRSCTTGCKLQPEPVKIRKTCDHPGYYKQVCHLEYVPCEGKVEEYTAMPIYQGCFDENGNKIDGGSSVYRAAGEPTEINVPVEVSVPAAYEQGVAKNTKKANGNGKSRMMKKGKTTSSMMATPAA